jgi:hypothetical protein
LSSRFVCDLGKELPFPFPSSLMASFNLHFNENDWPRTDLVSEHDKGECSAHGRLECGSFPAWRAVGGKPPTSSQRGYSGASSHVQPPAFHAAAGRSRWTSECVSLSRYRAPTEGSRKRRAQRADVQTRGRAAAQRRQFLITSHLSSLNSTIIPHLSSEIE